MGAEEDGQVSIFSQAKSLANSRKQVPAAAAASSQLVPDDDVRSKTSAQSRLSLAFISQRGK